MNNHIYHSVLRFGSSLFVSATITVSKRITSQSSNQACFISIKADPPLQPSEWLLENKVKLIISQMKHFFDSYTIIYICIHIHINSRLVSKHNNDLCFQSRNTFISTSWLTVFNGQIEVYLKSPGQQTFKCLHILYLHILNL